VCSARHDIAAHDEIAVPDPDDESGVAGGWIADHIGWRMLMIAPLPGIVALFVLSLLVLPFDSQLQAEREAEESTEEQKKESGASFDWLGAVVFAGQIGCLLFATTRGNDLGWRSSTVVGCAIGAVVLLPLLVIVERRAECVRPSALPAHGAGETAKRPFLAVF